ncbi:MAG: HAMP domain-containing histidine kinase [Bacteroidaceae bacterium]|nr:HAMP domain-containing histidine kinase [Bacteroidaceae bacterium]
MKIVLAVILLVLLVCAAIYYRQRKMRKASRLIIEAIDNQDYTFRLSEKGYMFGDKVLIKALNSLLQRIGEERQDVEVQSWEKLTRILTHEIMNGIAPISSLSDVFMKRKDVQDSPIYDGIKAIHDTSMGLKEFVESYRKFTTLQQPEPEEFSLRELIDGVKNLETVPHGISLTIRYDLLSDIVFADKSLIRQVVINIVKNAVESFSNVENDDKKICIFAYKYENTPFRISISNNGAPIPEEVRPDIFIPFYSTKKTGSGIGLALCRQIMQMTGGTINLLRANTDGWATTFVVELPDHRKD